MLDLRPRVPKPARSVRSKNRRKNPPWTIFSLTLTNTQLTIFAGGGLPVPLRAHTQVRPYISSAYF
jgi:hypothetical protein